MDSLQDFLTNGQTTQDGQRNAGNWERANAAQPAPQQPYESSQAYNDRVNAYNKG